MKNEILNFLINEGFKEDTISLSASRSIKEFDNYINEIEDECEAVFYEFYEEFDKGIAFNQNNTKVLIMYNKDWCGIGCCITDTKELELNKITLEEFKQELIDIQTEKPHPY